MRHLTIHEAAETLQLSVPTIKRYIYDGKLHSTKLPGGQHRIPESEIERLLALSEPTAAPDPGGAEASAEQRVTVLERWVTELEADVERLTVSLEVVSRYCSRKCEGEISAIAASTEPSPHCIAVLGPGCRRCDALHEAVSRALRDMGRTKVITERVADLDDIAAYGPILTPALAVDGMIVVSGRVPTGTALRKLLEQHLG
jgi:excisionase family DNA binding protein